MESMKAQKQSKDSKIGLRVKAEKQVDVLYQKMGDRWFAFSLIEDEIFFGSIAQSDIDLVHQSNLT